MEQRYIKTSELVTNTGQVPGLPSNPRQWTRQELDKLKKSLAETPELFDARGILVYPYGGEYIVLGGNMRLEASKALKLPEVPCIIVPEDTPTDKLKELVVKDNGAFGEWDYDKLANEWDDLPLNEWGVPTWETQAQPDPEVEDDGFDEEIEYPHICERGDVWKLGEHILMCGDSTNEKDVEILMGGQEADMVFTDPPYGVSYVGVNNPNGKEWQMIENDNLRGDSLYQFLLHAFQNMAKALKADGAFYVWFASSNHMQFESALNEAGLRVKQELIWDKGMVLGHSDYHWSYESCLYGTHLNANCKWYGDRSQKTFLAMNRTEIRDMKKDDLIDLLLNLHDGRDCWRIDRDNTQEYIHPTQKPIELAGRGIKNSSCCGQIVLDLFSGSGSTLMACEQLGRSARAMEFDPTYCDKIIARWERYTQKQAEKIN